jgi:lysozyme family protein
VAKYEPAVTITLDPNHEGGFQRNYDDSGNWTGGEVGKGELVGTNGGITPQDMPGKDIAHLTTEDKIEFYRGYWKPAYNDIRDQVFASKLFDMGVLFGIGESIIVLQLVLGLTADGAFGPVTLAAVNDHDGPSLLKAYQAGLVTHAIAIATKHPEKRIFLNGWIRRVNS